MSEQDFKRAFRARWKQWSDTIEHGRGSGSGQPDLLLAERANGWTDTMEHVPSLLVPVELKVGTIARDHLFPEEVRPAQMQWWREYVKTGGRGALVTGVMINGRWSAWSLQLDSVSVRGMESWRQGWPLIMLRPVMSDGQMVPSWSPFFGRRVGS